MTGVAITAPSGLRGFDCNTFVSTDSARALHALGHRFCCRYVRRDVARSNDLSVREIEAVFRGGLALMIVQHVEPGEWTPSDDKGKRYGDNAGGAALALDVPRGVTVWLDLESVALGTSAETVIRFCNYWHDRVAAVGYQPGIYVGWQPILTAQQLYQRLKFGRYWGAYNLDRDKEPATRGLCMRQHEAPVSDRRAVPFELDVNTINADHLGGLPTLFAPDEWDGR